MQLRHVSTNLRQGLRRNLSMHLAVVLTLFISLTLAGVGLMLSKQADLTAEVLGNELQIQAYLCVPDDPNNSACTGEVTDAQKQRIDEIVAQNPEVADYHFESKQVGFQKIKELLGPEQFEGPDAAFTVEDVPQSVWITLEDPNDFDGIVSALQNADGVSYLKTARDLVGPVYSMIDVLKYASWGAASVLVLAAILLVGNTIRLAALARRKEIEIMRLVGASRIFISLPFLLEALVTAVVGVALAGGALAAFTHFALVEGLDASSDALPFIGWPAYWETAIVVAAAGPVLTVLPTLLLTRKYLRV